MNKFFRIPLAITLFIFCLFCFSGCTDISKSTNYKTYQLKYLVNLSNIDDAQKEAVLNNLEMIMEERLKKFDVDSIEINIIENEGQNYLSLNFGTIDGIKEIRLFLEKNDPLIIREKIEKSENFEEKVENKASEVLGKLNEDGMFEIIAQNEVLKDPERVVYSEADWMYRDEIKEVFAEVLFDMEPGEIYQELIKYEEKPFVLAPPISIVSILKLFDKQEIERVIKEPKTVEVSHILIAYKGAMRASEEITRTSDEAREIANGILEQLKNGGDFIQLAYENSDDQSNQNTGGKLGTPAGQGVYVEQFENAALALEEDGDISDIVESPFGFHIIKADSVSPASEESNIEEQVKFGVLFFAQTPSEWEDTELTHEYLKNIDVMYSEKYDPFIIIAFNTEGKELLRKITEENMENTIGVFAGRNLIISFNVQEINESGEIKILKPSTTKEADELKEILTMDPLPAPIIFKEEIET